MPQAEVMGAPAPVVAPEPEAGGPGLEAVAPPRPVHALAASNGQPPRPILADPNLRALRAIPAWPNTVEEAPPPGAHDPVTDAESELPLDTLSPEDLEELDPDELLELDPEPQVDARGEPVQQVMSFASAPASPPPPLPPRLERTVTPVQFRQLDTSWAFKAPGGSPPPSPSVRSLLVAPPTLAPPPPPRVAEPAPEPQRGASVPVAPPPSPAPPPAAGAPAILPVAPAPPSSPVLESAIMLSPAKAREVKQRPADFPPDTVFNGELLRKVRIAQGLSLDDIAARTRITRKTLENVEAERFGELPALVYLRGTLMSLSTTLGLDPLRVSKSYLDLVQAGRSAPKQR